MSILFNRHYQNALKINVNYYKLLLITQQVFISLAYFRGGECDTWLQSQRFDLIVLLVGEQ